MLRKTLASALTALLVALLLPLGVSASAPIPACCRRDGKHHCAMPAPDTGGPALSELCPHHRQPVSLASHGLYAARTGITQSKSVAAQSCAVVVGISESGPFLSHTRGPPPSAIA